MGINTLETEQQRESPVMFSEEDIADLFAVFNEHTAAIYARPSATILAELIQFRTNAETLIQNWDNRIEIPEPLRAVSQNTDANSQHVENVLRDTLSMQLPWELAEEVISRKRLEAKLKVRKDTGDQLRFDTKMLFDQYLDERRLLNFWSMVKTLTEQRLAIVETPQLLSLYSETQENLLGLTEQGLMPFLTTSEDLQIVRSEDQYRKELNESLKNQKVRTSTKKGKEVFATVNNMQIDDVTMWHDQLSDLHKDSNSAKEIIVSLQRVATGLIRRYPSPYGIPKLYLVTLNNNFSVMEVYGIHYPKMKYFIPISTNDSHLKIISQEADLDLTSDGAVIRNHDGLPRLVGKHQILYALGNAWQNVDIVDVVDIMKDGTQHGGAWVAIPRLPEKPFRPDLLSKVISVNKRGSAPEIPHEPEHLVFESAKDEPILLDPEPRDHHNTHTHEYSEHSLQGLVAHFLLPKLPENFRSGRKFDDAITWCIEQLKSEFGNNNVGTMRRIAADQSIPLSEKRAGMEMYLVKYPLSDLVQAV